MQCFVEILRLKTVIYFRKTLHLTYLTGLWIPLWTFLWIWIQVILVNLYEKRNSIWISMINKHSKNNTKSKFILHYSMLMTMIVVTLMLMVIMKNNYTKHFGKSLEIHLKTEFLYWGHLVVFTTLENIHENTKLLGKVLVKVIFKRSPLRSVLTQ